MSGDVRAFLAIRLPCAVTASLARLIDQAGGRGVDCIRPVKPENMHLTVRFFGNVSAQQVESIIAAVRRSARSIRPFTLTLGGVGAYPSVGNARVVWVGLEDDGLAPLLDTRRRIDDALAQAAFERDHRKFSPHVTIARIRDRASRVDRQKAAESLFSAKLDSALPIPVERISLMRSVLLPSGPEYSALAEIPLEGTKDGA